MFQVIMIKICYNLRQIMFNQEEFDVLGQTEGVSEDVNEVVNLLGRQLEGQEGGHDPGEGGHVVRGVQSYK